jgi:muconate cycloisomerase
MKIERIEAIAVSLPLTQPLKRSKGVLTSADNVLVRVAAGGVVGWGEAGSAPTMTGEFVESMVAAIRHLAPFLEGAQLSNIAQVSAIMDSNLYGNSGAKAAIEMAAHDALGKLLGKPVYELLGGKRRTRIPALRMIASGDVATDVAEASRCKSEGYTAYKIKVGAGAVSADIARTREVCTALGKDVLISADANQNWSVAQALEYVRAVKDTTIDFLEQPVAAENLAGMAEIAAATRLAIGCDEGVHGLADVRNHHAARAASGASLKAIKLGGLRPMYETAVLCDQLGMHVNLACKIAESGIATAAVLHMAAAVPSLAWGVSLTSQYLAEDVLVRPLAFTRGHAQVPEGPGLGVEVDEARVNRFAVQGL